MPKKNILFITHHNNDFDHFLPLIVHLKKQKNINVINLAFYHKYELMQNKLHRYICNENDVELDSITDLFIFSLLNAFIVKVHKYIIEKLEMTKKPDKKHKFLKLQQQIIEKYLAIASIFLLTNKRMRNYLEKNKIHFAIIDIRGTNEKSIDINPIKRFILLFKKRKEGSMDNLLFRFTKRCREKNIPIFMMHHGPYPVFWEFTDKDRIYHENLFRPDYLVVSNKKNMEVYKNVKGLKDTLYLGDPRYDLDWINYLEKCSLKVYKNQIEKPKDKTVLLYLMDIFKFVRGNPEKNKSYKYEIHKDILSMVNEFENLEIWVKHHPRTFFRLQLKDLIGKGKQNRIKQFGKDVDTNVLLYLSDIRLATSSTTLINPVIQKRAVIFYDKWKEKLNATTIYDNLNYNASSKKELKNQIKRIMEKGYTIEDKFLNKFYKDVFTISSPSTSMTELYTNKIIELIG